MSTFDQYLKICRLKTRLCSDIDHLQDEFTFERSNQEKLDQVIEHLSRALQPLQDLEDFLNEVLESHS